MVTALHAKCYLRRVVRQSILHVVLQLLQKKDQLTWQRHGESEIWKLVKQFTGSCGIRK
jgi:hypothetical protein